MTIINSKEELEQHLKEAREDVAYWRVHTFKEIMEEINLKMNKEKLCIR